jgi:hypothetical protein
LQVLCELQLQQDGQTMPKKFELPSDVQQCRTSWWTHERWQATPMSPSYVPL